MPYRSKAFIRFAKGLPGPCCVCRSEPGVELHHFGDKGMGQRASDLLVARVCRECHGRVQGKRLAHSFERSGMVGEHVALLADNVALLAAYVEELER